MFKLKPNLQLYPHPKGLPLAFTTLLISLFYSRFCSSLYVLSCLWRLVSIKNRLEYVSGFTAYNYEDDRDYWALGGVTGDITVVGLVETDPDSDPTLGRDLHIFSMLFVSCSTIAFCYNAAHRVWEWLLVTVLLWCSHLTTDRCVTVNTWAVWWQLRHRLYVIHTSYVTTMWHHGLLICLL